MGKRFEPVTLEYGGSSYSVAPNRVLGLIDCIEEHITLYDLSVGTRSPGSVRMARLAQAYGAALRYAGATDVTDEDVYHALFGKGGTQTRQTMMTVIGGLLAIMVPPSEVVEKMDPESETEVDQATEGTASSDQPSAS